MGKNITVMLPQGIVQHVAVADALTSITFTGENGGGILSMPIEEYIIDGKVHYIARSSDLITDKEIIAAINSHK
ncbi:hypothetical protein [Ewingella americana]